MPKVRKLVMQIIWSILDYLFISNIVIKILKGANQFSL